MDASNRTLKIKSDAAAATTEPFWSVLVHEITASAAGVVTGSLRIMANGVTTGTTPVSMVAAPAAGKQRQVLEIVVRNRDTAQRTITIVEGDGTTDYDLHKIVLPAGWSAIYGHDSKWKKYDDEGTEVSVGEPGAPGTNGTNGSNGALSVIETEIDFGSDAVRQKRITVSAPGVTPTSKIIVCQSANAATGGSSDDSEAEPIHFSVTPGTNQFTVVATPLFGPVSGRFKIFYQFST